MRARVSFKPLAENDLLLVSAGQRCNGIRGTHALGVHDVDLVGGGLYHLVSGEGNAGYIVRKI